MKTNMPGANSTVFSVAANQQQNKKKSQELTPHCRKIYQSVHSTYEYKQHNGFGFKINQNMTSSDIFSNSHLQYPVEVHKITQSAMLHI